MWTDFFHGCPSRDTMNIFSESLIMMPLNFTIELSGLEIMCRTQYPEVPGSNTSGQ